MEYLVFRSSKSQNRVIVPAEQTMVVDRSDGCVVVYAIGGNGRDRMVWEVPDVASIRITQTMREALNLRLPADRSEAHLVPDTAKTEAVHLRK